MMLDMDAGRRSRAQALGAKTVLAGNFSIRQCSSACWPISRPSASRSRARPARPVLRDNHNNAVTPAHQAGSEARCQLMKLTRD
jgi:hypothetical protein